MEISKIFVTLFISLVFIKFGNTQAINLDDLYFEVDANYMNQVISNITSFIETYVYLDIIQNPPNSFHSKINLIEEFKKIDTNNSKPFYEFLRELTRITAKMKDYHISFMPTINNANFYYACIPFSFDIQLDDNRENQLYFKNYPICPFSYSDPELIRFIDDSIKEKKSISSIIILIFNLIKFKL